MKRRTIRGSKQSVHSLSAGAVIRKVIQLEEQVWKAAQQRDVKKFAALVPPDGVMIFQSGIVRQRDYLATLRDRTISGYELRDIRGFMPNSRTVILIYEATRSGTFKGKEFPSGTVIESSTWIKRGKRWLAVLNQETPINSAEPTEQS